MQENQTGSYPALKKIWVAKRENDYNVSDGAFGDLRDLTTTMSGANLYARGRSCEATTPKKSSCKNDHKMHKYLAEHEYEYYSGSELCPNTNNVLFE